jgi:UDP-glucose 4-epimerase
MGAPLAHQGLQVTTLNLLECMVEADVKRFIFSSTEAIFGEPAYTPIDEVHPLHGA